MTHEERTDIVLRLIAMQHTLRAVCESVDAASRMAEDAGGHGLAVAGLLMKESIAEYAKQLNKFVLGMLDDGI